MSVTYKDIDQLSQKSTVAGTEKIPVSDTQYLTPAQIATSKQVHLQSESGMPGSPDSSTLYLIDDDGETYVSATSAQVLTSAQKTQARANIGAASSSELTDYPKYVLLANEAAYTALSTKDSGTLYLIPKTS